MRIVVIAGYAPSLVNFRAPLLRALRAKGHDVLALAPFPDTDEFQASGATESALAALGIRLVRFKLGRGGLNPLADASSILAIRAELAAFRAELVIPYTIKPVLYASVAARLPGSGRPAVASLVTGLGYAFGEASGPKTRRRQALTAAAVALYRVALHGNSVVFFQNPDDAAFFADAKITTARHRVVVVNGSGVDLHQFAFAPPVLPTAEVGPVFLCVARLLWAKGVGVFADAARILKARHPRAVFRLLGPADPGPDGVPQTVLDEWRTEGFVEVLPPTSDVRPALAAASVFVLPTNYREGTPRSLLEALAMGRPVITTDAPGCRQTVRPGVNGFLVQANDPAALAEAMSRFITDPSLIAPMGRAGRALAEHEYGADDVAASMLRALNI